MSIPPQLIRVKRKRVEEAPVTFLQFDQDSKRHRNGRHWAYQRRDSTVSQPVRDNKSTQPVIHVSKSDDTPSSRGKQDVPSASQKPEKRSATTIGLLEPRRFHVSRIKSAAQLPGPAGISKKNRYSPAVFVESTRKKMVPRTRRSFAQLSLGSDGITSTPEAGREQGKVEQRQLKRPGVANRARSAAEQPSPNKITLPDSFINRHHQDMEKITNDMNQWVLNELGANLKSMEQNKSPPRFKPKSPAKRFHERHPDLAVETPSTQMDTAMSEVSDDEDDDDDEWVIEEYVRIPAHSVALDVLPTDVGILVLDEDEESMLFFGSAVDEDDEQAEDDEDENAENHYTADYPEDEVDSEDEYGRQAYLYRHGNNSDEEEFDEDLYEEQDEMALERDTDDNDDARMARIKEFMKRNSAFR